MKKLFTYIFVLLSLQSFSQAYTIFNGYGFRSKRTWNDSVSIQPADTNVNKYTGSLAIKGTSLFVASSGKWSNILPATITNLSSGKLLGRYSAGSGAVQEITVGTNLNLSAEGVLSATNNFVPKYASYYDTTTQTANANQTKSMKFSTLDIDGTSGFTKNGDTSFTASITGIYNIQFSAQINRTSGGQIEQVYIWLRKNNTDVTWSNTTISLSNNGDKVVASWNFFLSLTSGDNFQLMWHPTVSTIQLLTNTSISGLPKIPSIILTIQKIN